jgi:hypothetical protein
MSLDSLLFQFGIEGSRLFDFYEPLPGVCLSQPSPFDDPETEHVASLRSDCAARLLQSLSHFVCCSARKPSFAHSGYPEGKMHVGLI